MTLEYVEFPYRFPNRKPEPRVRIRKGPKNHSVNKERSHFDRKKHRQRVHKRRVDLAVGQQYRDAVRAYWRGEIDEHP